MSHMRFTLRRLIRPSIFALIASVAIGYLEVTVRLKADTTYLADATYQQSTSAGPFSVVEKSIFDLKNAMDDGRATSRQLVEQYLARIKAYDQAGPKINAFI